MYSSEIQENTSVEIHRRVSSAVTAVGRPWRRARGTSGGSSVGASSSFKENLVPFALACIGQRSDTRMRQSRKFHQLPLDGTTLSEDQSSCKTSASSSEKLER